MVNLRSVVVALSACVLLVKGQGAGTLATEGKPQITIQTCTAPGACSNVQSSVVLDANWRWVHDSNGQNCYTGNTWASSCNNDQACASTCMLEQVSSDQYMNTYGITTQNGNSLSLQLVTGANVGSRIYLNDGTSDKYMKFHLLNNEFTFDVDTSKEVCGLNGALYFVEMDADGGLSKYPGNKAGSKYGTGYCDAQCPQDLKFINGQANVEGWTPSSGDKNSGMGNHGSCCAEMDIWEANNMATAYTPHPCTVTGQQMCQDGTTTPCAGSSSQRYNGVCDRDGCDFNAYRSGNTSFYGPGKTLDTNSPMTVVTQFVTSDGTNTGDLVEIRRAYVQNGKTIWNANSALTGLCNANSVDTNFCNYQKALFGDQNDFATKGGLKAMGQAMSRGMVLTMSLWVDYAANCLWLDSAYPTNKDASLPGVKRGECATNSGAPAQVIQNSPSSKVTFSNIRFGPIGSTTPGVPNQGPYAAKPCSSGATPAPSSNTAANTGANTNANTANTASTGGSNTNAASNTGANTNTNTGASTNAASNTGASNSGASSSPTSAPNCPIGAETCPCTAGGACNSGLTCLSKLCVKSGRISSSASTVAVSALAVTAAAALAFAF